MSLSDISVSFFLYRCSQLARLLTSVALVLSLLVPHSAHADVLGDATNIVKQLSPVNLALGGLIDNAVASGNSSLAERLQQLQAIVQEALFSLDQIAERRISQIDSAAANRLGQLQGIVNQVLPELNSLIEGRIIDINDALYQRIQQFGNTTGNLIASLPIPTDPLPNVGPNGITLVRDAGRYTTLFVTGSGLFKNGVKPEAFILKDGEATAGIGTLLKHPGTPLEVHSASMGLVEMRLPNELFRGHGVTNLTLQLKLFRGGLTNRYPEPSIPLHVCSTLPKYTVVVTQTASGRAWVTRRAAYPSPVNRPDGVYITDNGSNNHTSVCADGFDGWEVDPNYPGGGLEIGSSGADRGAVYPNNPRVGCYYLYAGKDSGGGGNAWVGGYSYTNASSSLLNHVKLLRWSPWRRYMVDRISRRLILNRRLESVPRAG